MQHVLYVEQESPHGSRVGKDFYLIDKEGNKRVPIKIRGRDGEYGYAIHPVGKGNDASSATYTEDERELVRAVVLHGCGVRARAVGGLRDGQVNTVAMGKRAVSGYWLCPTRVVWVESARVRPVNEGIGE